MNVEASTDLVVVLQVYVWDEDGVSRRSDSCCTAGMIDQNRENGEPEDVLDRE